MLVWVVALQIDMLVWLRITLFYFLAYDEVTFFAFSPSTASWLFALSLGVGLSLLLVVVCHKCDMQTAHFLFYLQYFCVSLPLCWEEGSREKSALTLGVHSRSLRSNISCYAEWDFKIEDLSLLPWTRCFIFCFNLYFRLMRTLMHNRRKAHKP